MGGKIQGRSPRRNGVKRSAGGGGVGGGADVRGRRRRNVMKYGADRPKRAATVGSANADATVAPPIIGGVWRAERSGARHAER